VINELNLWIVDPIDGTTNFAHGIPLSGVIIAYASKGVCEFGLIYDPYRNETFTAWRGQGAFMNDRKIFCCKTPTMAKAVVATGSPPNEIRWGFALACVCVLCAVY
jgi:myo-inositol-1(or 4)-monophosphatase